MSNPDFIAKVMQNLHEVMRRSAETMRKLATGFADPSDR